MNKITMIDVSLEEIQKIVETGIETALLSINEKAEDCFVSPKKAAKLLDCSIRTLDNYPELKKYRNGGLVRYRKSEVMAFLKKFEF